MLRNCIRYDVFCCFLPSGGPLNYFFLFVLLSDTNFLLHAFVSIYVVAFSCVCVVSPCCRHKPFGVTAILGANAIALISIFKMSHYFYLSSDFICRPIVQLGSVILCMLLLFCVCWVWYYTYFVAYYLGTYVMLLVRSMVSCPAVSRIFYGIWTVPSSILRSLSCWISLSNVIFLWWTLYPLVYRWLRSCICFYVFWITLGRLVFVMPVLCTPFTRLFIVCVCFDWCVPIQHCDWENTQYRFYGI